jgi:hypothetical protein
MLSVCQFCEQVIEIPMLTEHLLVECAGRDKHPESKVKHSECPRCHLAVPATQLEAHIEAATCPGTHCAHRVCVERERGPSMCRNFTASTMFGVCGRDARDVSDGRPAHGASRCPMCKKDFSADSGRDVWKVHLLDEGCPSNPRTSK